jgi:hypothetical protein
MTTALVVALRPLVSFLLFAVIVAPITWLLFRVIPDGRLKVLLFKVRTGEHASRRDKAIMTLAVIGAYLLLLLTIVVVTR